ncbi:quercetin 2,3-dioxygenase [Subtercola boreus]|uniref:Cupin n=1 Tax=Subtercola boreus TaxID=120213 RepID=A0A3E0WEI5_9MICO|nr:quercetin 2,3-dioxygenase [Subtercola boreus]RFA23650.1 cupin [Subtercola boreus]RFA24044.1 cupin [Subtercola boreus]RFA29742.1 cupin [Subtercola boreus]
MSDTPPTPVVDRLPGETLPYLMTAGEGARYEIDGRLITLIARPEDTGSLFGAHYVSGGRGAEAPFAVHAAEHQTVVVFDGLLHFWLGDQARLLAPGDTVSIPAGTPFAYRFLSNYTRILFYSAGGASLGLVPRVGLPIDAHVHPARPEHLGTVDELRDVGAAFGISYPDLQKSDAALQHDETRPAGVVPYFLSSGEGERTRNFNQLNTFLSRGENTGSDYFAMHTTGAKAGYIPLHFHQRHTENFLCLEGRIRLHVNGRELLLTKGDFVHAPAGTIHSFSLDSHHTQMVGFLAPSIFEKFFDYMNEPTTDAVYPEGGEFFFPGEGFARAQAELDLVVVGAPPTRSAALDV